MNFYSQQGEDREMRKILERIRPGLFSNTSGPAREHGHVLEVGAWDPFQLSNSRHLIESGWNAMLVEPSPEPLKKLLAAYLGAPNIRIFAAALTPGVECYAGSLKMTDDAVSTDSPAVEAVWREKGGYLREMCVPMFPVHQFLVQFGSGWDVISIDTEGSSVDLAKRFLLDLARPTLYCVEYDRRLDELLIFAQEFGYKQAHLNSTNVILVRE